MEIYSTLTFSSKVRKIDLLSNTDLVVLTLFADNTCKSFISKELTSFLNSHLKLRSCNLLHLSSTFLSIFLIHRSEHIRIRCRLVRMPRYYLRSLRSFYYKEFPINKDILNLGHCSKAQLAILAQLIECFLIDLLLWVVSVHSI